MPSIRLDDDIKPLSEFRANASTFVRQLHRTKRPIIITQNGKTAAVLLDVSEYQRLLDRLEALEKIEPKTKNMSSLINTIEKDSKNKKVLLVTNSTSMENVYRASRNIKEVRILTSDLLNTYEVLNNSMIYFMKQAVDAMAKEGEKA